MQTLLQQVEHYLARSDTGHAAFGKRACGDPNLVADLRRGRVPGAAVSQRVRTWIAAHPPQRAADDGPAPLAAPEAHAHAALRASSAALHRAMIAAYARTAQAQRISLNQAAWLMGMRP